MTGRKKRRNNQTLIFYLFISPWLFGFLVLAAGPMIYSLYMSFTDWQIFGGAEWIGLENYENLLFNDPLFWKTLWNTFYFTFFGVPLSLVFGYLLAVLLNQKVKFMGVFRTIFYLPSIVPAVASSLLWLLIFQPEFGLANAVLNFLNLPTSNWILSESMVKPALIIMGLWGVGGGMVIYLAGLQGVPPSLYEAAEIDGAGKFRKFWNVTVPMTSHVIFFNLIMGIIGSFQVFTQAYVMSNGGPNYASLFYVLYLYQNAFQFFKMGYASALAWILFLIILVFTLLQFKFFGKKVYYEYDD
ncbi:carbohydrate ABC transporter permease [Alkalicoccobacillus murimartini]|uniref:Multiple sugar transport system permease protein n=1 Tax=Alkalicoccobacillus murimartini TaxID=171685 RepID=A0ABT9YMG1_9BACI|nr:sugar ABC transporter permease [Alkalicoccobacillus murimartini]MDQ0209045.1 multiple sugar transport system permease protein [Alkalicoccobacillus murimartini]